MEVDGIRELGVTMHSSRRFSFDGRGTSFQKMGFQASFLRWGPSGFEIEYPGRDLERNSFRSFIPERCQSGQPCQGWKKSGGYRWRNVALDVAVQLSAWGRTKFISITAGRKKKCLRSPKKLRETIQEGIKIHFLASPIRFVGEGERATGIEFARMRLTEPMRREDQRLSGSKDRNSRSRRTQSSLRWGKKWTPGG